MPLFLLTTVVLAVIMGTLPVGATVTLGLFFVAVVVISITQRGGGPPI